MRIIQKERTRIVVCRDLTERLAETYPELAHHEDDAEHDAAHQTERLQQVGAYDRADAAATCVEPHQSHHQSHVHYERHSVRFEYECLQYGAYQECTQRSTRHLRYEEEPRPRSIGACPETFVEILVQRYDIQAIEHRDKNVGYNDVADDESGDHLQIRESALRHRPGNRYERYARYCGPDHRQRGHKPRGPPPAREECGVVAAARRAPRDKKQHRQIQRDGNGYGYGFHVGVIGFAAKVTQK